MIWPYRDVSHGVYRPLVDVLVEGLEFPWAGLVDTGAIETLMSAEVAEAGEIALATDVERHRIGGRTLDVRFATVRLAIPDLDHTWEARVGFCDNWQHPFAVLGHEGFLRQFTLTLRAADLEFELEPIAE